jgi:ribosome maturation factor RimP
LDRTKLDSLITLVSQTLAPHGFECIEAEWSAGERVLRLFVDTLAGEGINLDGCVTASRLLEDLPALDEVMPGKYTLEVSSPGVERPLRSRSHFESHLGETVSVKLMEKYLDRRQGTGKVIQVADGDTVTGQSDTLITLQTEQGDWSFPLAQLQRASLVYDWSNG